MGFLLIPRLGVIGFQAATIIAPKLGLVYSFWWIRKNLSTEPDLSTTTRVAVSAVLGYLACNAILWVFVLSIWVEIILGGFTLALVYLLSILLSGALTKANLSDEKRITGRSNRLKPLADPLIDLMIQIARY